MPVEERFIAFDFDEIYNAVSILSVQEAGCPVLPEGTLCAIELDTRSPADEDVIHLSITPSGGGGAVRVHYGRGFFARALVLLCQASGVPLPRRGTKKLKVLDDRIVMKIDLKS